MESNAKNKSANANPSLFIRNLDYKETNESLTKALEDYGPLKFAYVVSTTGSNGEKQCRGFGYAKFADPLDAQKAIKEVKVIGGRRVAVKMADEAPKHEKTPKDGKVPRVRPTKQATKKPPTVAHNQNEESSKPGEERWVKGASRAIVRNIPFRTGEAEVKELFSGIGPIQDISLPRDGDKHRGFAIIGFAAASDAVKAVQKLHGSKMMGRALEVTEFTKKKQQPSKTAAGGKKELPPFKQTPTTSPIKQSTKNSQKAELIIRNLSFTFSEKSLQSAMAKYGAVMQVRIPPKKGFGFVTFANRADAQSVIEKLNLQPMGGRKVAIDWAIDRRQHQTVKQNQQINDEPEIKQEAVEIKQEPMDDSEDAGSDEEVPTKKGNHTDGSDSGSDSDAESDDDSGDDSEDSGVDEEGSESDGADNKPVKKTYRNSSADINEDRTLFLRNLSFSVTEEEIHEAFSQWGEITYVKLLTDPLTERSRGVAFVQYKTKAEADKCQEAYEDREQADAFMFGGQRVNVTIAVSRETISDINKMKEKQPKDKRNLYLAREGVIRDGTQAAEGVSKTDMNKRNKLVIQKKEKLKNPLIFISATRLCMHNIPLKINDKQLASIICKHYKEQPNVRSKITECRIMRNMETVNSEGVAKSRGYAFIDFSEHSYALGVLRALNNNPEVFTDDKRPIVEFSLENQRAVQAKAKRQANATLKGGSKKGKPVKEVAERVERPKDVKPGLPSHLGPKIRHKKRGEGDEEKRKAEKRAKKRAAQIAEKNEKERFKQPAPKKKKIEDSKPDRFEQLVSKYRNQISSTLGKSKTKWYEST